MYLDLAERQLAYWVKGPGGGTGAPTSDMREPMTAAQIAKSFGGKVVPRG